LSYTEPWVLGTNVSLTGSVGQQTVDTTYAQMNLALAASAPAAAGTDVTLETGFDQYTDVVRRQSVRVAWAGTGAVFDTRDFAPNPHSGVLLSLGTRAGTRTGDSAQDAVVSRSKLDLAVAVPLRRAVSWSNGFAGRLVYSPVELSEPELCRLGGTGSLRGYREDEFASTTVGWWSSELRFLLDRLSRLYPFFDLGTYYDSGVWRLKYGYGAGAVAATAAGVFGFDYGIAFSENLLRGKVHLSFEAEF
jgi:outer membrane protein assembly factor BamA